MAGTVCNAVMMTMSGRVLSERLDVLRLTFYTAPVSCLCLLPFYSWQEVTLIGSPFLPTEGLHNNQSRVS